MKSFVETCHFKFSIYSFHIFLYGTLYGKFSIFIIHSRFFYHVYLSIDRFYFFFFKLLTLDVKKKNINFNWHKFLFSSLLWNYQHGYASPIINNFSQCQANIIKSLKCLEQQRMHLRSVTNRNKQTICHSNVTNDPINNITPVLALLVIFILIFINLIISNSPNSRFLSSGIKISFQIIFIRESTLYSLS